MTRAKTESVNPAAVIAKIDKLVGRWCDRRCLRALRAILAGWPIGMGLTDDWGELLVALKNVRAFARDELTEDESNDVGEAIAEIQTLIDPAGRRTR